jgi:hypothetical protein
MKRLSPLKLVAAAALLAALPLATVSAVTSTHSPTPTPSADRLANLKSKGTTEIDRRLANLNAALTKLTASTKLSATDKATLTKQVQAEITGLTALKAKLAADTDLATARADVASIVADYRVYVLMLPKVRMVASADRFAVAEQKLTVLHDKLKAKVDPEVDNSASTSNATALTAKLDDMAAKIADAKAKSASMVTQLLALQPTDYNANHAVLVGYRASLKTAQTDLKAARDDAKFVADALKATK